MTPLFGAMYDEPGDVVACEDHAANPFVLPGERVPVRWLRTMLASTTASVYGSRSSTALWHTPVLEVELDTQCGAITMLRRG